MAASKMYKDIFQRFYQHTDSLLENIVHVKQCMPYEQYVSLFWTKEQRLQVADTMWLRSTSNYEGQMRSLQYDFNHPLLSGATDRITIHCRKMGTHNDMPEQHIPVRAGAPFEALAMFNSIVQEAVHRALDIGNYKTVLSMLGNKCETLAQVRYCFPPVLALLRRYGYDDHATKHEEVTKRPAGMPSFTGIEVLRIRHAIQWFTAQLLLGTFEETPSLPYGMPPSDGLVKIGIDRSSTVTFNGNEFDMLGKS